MDTQNPSIINLSDSAALRISEIRSKSPDKKYLRITVAGGGCSGFRYDFALDDKINDDDIKIEKNNEILLLTDEVSLGFLKGSEVDFIRDLGGMYFKINNPNSTANCGCGSSFSV